MQAAYSDQFRIRAALDTATHALMTERGSHGHWRGELSDSALSTATAVVALTTVDPTAHAALIKGGLRWLATHQNPDGGWGDTTRSKSNISTTALAWAAFGAAAKDHEFAPAVRAAKRWLNADEGMDSLVKRIADRYGKDRTFSVPILMTLALSGRLGRNGWKKVPKLPFELAALSHRFWGFLRLPVVSYALPALIAIGQTIHHHAPTRNPFTRIFRGLSGNKTLRVLESLQPGNGGFLEATPLTSFVTMSLGAMGLRKHPVVEKGVQFLVGSVRADGSWPIDTDLATWTTTMAVKALTPQPGALNPDERETLRRWILGQQWNCEHPYTHAAPGGWAWTDLPGGVPDADDTPGALLALLGLGTTDELTVAAGGAGVRWLLDLQNRDGGIPTFCRGWGALPFDRSSPDLTAHTLRAWKAWRSRLPEPDQIRLDRATTAAIEFLLRVQRADGSWLPLWFGNEEAPDDENPVYGTTHVLEAVREFSAENAKVAQACERASAWLAAIQNEEGGWGGHQGIRSTTEETALAVEALAPFPEHRASVMKGARWLAAKVEDGSWREPAPIGFYFAKLWYYERLYPLIWTVGALGRVRNLDPA